MENGQQSNQITTQSTQQPQQHSQQQQHIERSYYNPSRRKAALYENRASTYNLNRYQQKIIGKHNGCPWRPANFKYQPGVVGWVNLKFWRFSYHYIFGYLILKVVKSVFSCESGSIVLFFCLFFSPNRRMMIYFFVVQISSQFIVSLEKSSELMIKREKNAIQVNKKSAIHLISTKKTYRSQRNCTHNST